MPLGVNVTVEVIWIGAGTGSTIVAQQQADNPGQGQSQFPHSGPIAQRRFYRDFEAIPVAAGSEGSVTLANINTALTNAVTAFAGSTGTPIISTSEIAEIQGWATGNT